MTRGVLGSRNAAISSYYLGGKGRETVTSLNYGIADRLELGVSHYYQDKDWSASFRFELFQSGDQWWHPTAVFAIHDIGRPETADVSLTAVKRYTLPILGNVRLHAGVLKETKSGGDVKAFGGISKIIERYFDFSLIYDGYDMHFIFGTSYKGFRISLIAYKMEHVGVGFSYQFHL